MNNLRRLTLGGILTGLSVCVMLIGNLIGVGTYAAPLIAGILLLPVGMRSGLKYHITAYLAAGLLSFMLLSDREEALMFLCVFGWYPIARPYLERLKPPLNWIAKYGLLNLCAIAAETLVVLVIAPETLGLWMILLLLLLSNLTFVIYDRLLPRMEIILARRLNIKR